MPYPFSAPRQRYDGPMMSLSQPQSSMFQTQRIGGARYAPSAFGGRGYGGGFEESYPQMRPQQQEPQLPSMSGGGYEAPPAPSFQSMLGAANRGQIPRGPSAGFVTQQAGRMARGEQDIQHGGSVLNPNMLAQFGETGPQITDRLNGQQYMGDANTRANDQNGAYVRMSDSGAAMNNANAQGIPGMLQSQAGLNNARASGLNMTEPARAGLMDAQAQQATQLPAEHQQRMKSLETENQQLRSQLERFLKQENQIANRPQAQPKAPPTTRPADITAAYGDVLKQDSTIKHEDALKRAREVVQTGPDAFPPPAQATPQPQAAPQAAPPPVNTFGAQPQQAQSNVPAGATPNNDGSITMHGMRYVRDEQNKGWRKAG